MDECVTFSASGRPAIRLAKRDGVRLTRGVYLDHRPANLAAALAERARAALSVAPPGSMLTGLTALALLGVDLPASLGDQATRPIELLVPRAAERRPARRDICVHRADYPSKRWVFRQSGIPLAHPARCWVDLARHLAAGGAWRPGHEDTPTVRGVFTDPGKAAFLAAVQVADGLLRREKPLISMADFAAQTEGLARFRDCRTIKLWAGWARANTDSPTETWTRLIVTDAGFPDPVVNLEVLVAGRRRFVDLSWPDRKLGLEYQGRHHFDSPDQVMGDMDRRSGLVSVGWRLLEASHADLLRPAELLSRLAAAFAT
jgi:hypothetical protein